MGKWWEICLLKRCLRYRLSFIHTFLQTKELYKFICKEIVERGDKRCLKSEFKESQIRKHVRVIRFKMGSLWVVLCLWVDGDRDRCKKIYSRDNKDREINDWFWTIIKEKGTSVYIE
jgi:hypothetical protein